MSTSFSKDGDAILRLTRGETDPFAKYEGALAGLLPLTIKDIVREERLLRGHDLESANRPARRRQVQ